MGVSGDDVDRRRGTAKTNSQKAAGRERTATLRSPRTRNHPTSTGSSGRGLHEGVSFLTSSGESTPTRQQTSRPSPRSGKGRRRRRTRSRDRTPDRGRETPDGCAGSTGRPLPAIGPAAVHAVVRSSGSPTWTRSSTTARAGGRSPSPPRSPPGSVRMNTPQHRHERTPRRSPGLPGGGDPVQVGGAEGDDDGRAVEPSVSTSGPSKQGLGGGGGAHREGPVEVMSTLEGTSTVRAGDRVQGGGLRRRENRGNPIIKVAARFGWCLLIRESFDWCHCRCGRVEITRGQFWFL